MFLVPLNAGRLKAGSVLASPDGGEMLYVNVPTVVLLKEKVNVPTRVTPSAFGFQDAAKGVPLVTYASPVSDVGEVQLPPDITIHSGLKFPGAEGSGSRGSYVYHTAKAWLSVCCVNVTPQPDSLGLYQMSE